MKNIYAFIIATFLAACTTIPPSTITDASTTSAVPKKQPPLPTLALNKVLLYKLLYAEFAAQKEDWQHAFKTTLELAQETKDPRLARRASEIAIDARQPVDAFTAAQLWQELSPESEEALSLYLGFLVARDNLMEAQSLLVHHLTHIPAQDRSAFILQIQRILANATDKTLTFSLLEDLLTPYTSIPETHLALARGAFLKGDLTRATTETRTALSLKPDWELAILTLAQITPNQSDTTQLLAQFLTRYPRAHEVRIAYGKILIEQKQYPQAHQIFKTLLEQDPENITVLYILGMLNAQTSDFNIAEQYLTHYLRLLPTHTDEERDPTQALLVLAYIAENRNDISTALMWLAQVNATRGPNPAYISARIKQAQLLTKQGNFALARQQLHDVNTANEKDLILLMNAEAQLLQETGQIEEALTLFKNTAQQFPNNIDLLYNYAMLAEKLNQFDLMESLLNKIITIAPDNPSAYNALGFSFADRNVHLTEALTLIEKAVQLTPEDPFILDSMGWVQFRLGHLAEAELFLRRAYIIRTDAEIAAHLGEVLWTKGDKDAAQKLWDEAQRKNPENTALKNTVQRFQQ